jgi:bifunctional DNA-binding transcriptional regulator/antitoxin component of YhaV-PrlF toxin-antitoxin module
MTEDTDTETVVGNDYTVEIPETFREELALEPGDTVRWDVTDGGRLLLDIVEE